MGRSTAVFWDYENVPLPRKKKFKLIEALRRMKEVIEVEYFQIYTTTSRLNDEDRGYLFQLDINKKSISYVENTGKNAVDYYMMDAAISYLNQHPQVTQVLLITGDKDFMDFTELLPNRHVVVICQKANYSKKLISSVNESFSLKFVQINRKKWFYSNQFRE